MTEDAKNKPEQKRVVESLMEGLNKVIPGLQGAMNVLKKSEVFQKRLKEVENEVEERLKGKVGDGNSFSQDRTREIRRTLLRKEIPVEIFDEEDHVKVVAELPGVKEDEIHVSFSGNSLALQVNGTFLKGKKEITLPCVPLKLESTTCRNGLVEIRLKKCEEK